MRARYDYVEWDRKDAEAARRRVAEGAVASWCDQEIRERVGELIARAMQAANKKREP